jgi:ATP-dependent helicase Lhr and Lhr-like helicase
MTSEAFDRLHPEVQRWIWRQGWSELRDIQEQAIGALIAPGADVILAATTASGKTEAAFLPIVSHLANTGRSPGEGFQALYVSPLRALINDQFGRVEGLCEALNLPVVKWHGDVAAGVKAQAARRPGGIVLTTPESLEAMLVRRGPEVRRLFAALDYVVIDELHAFLDAPRGKQLQSILARLDAATARTPVRVGLSATLADMEATAGFLRPDRSRPVTVIQSKSGGQELRLQLRGYVSPIRAERGAPRDETRGDDEEEADAASPSLRAIVAHLFSTLRGERSLIFAGSRRRVEEVTVALAEMSEEAGMPDEFLAHHGSLSREHREEAERRMKDESRPASAVCTTTLELGIDIGHIDAVAQIGPGHTVSGMRQRLGRSGRRPGRPSVMRLYVEEEELDARSHPLDALRAGTVQAVAMVNLMLARWNEPPGRGWLHLSTLQHQILALVGELGGVQPANAYARLVKSGVFAAVDPALFARLLRRMGDKEVGLLEQAPDGLLLAGPQGERILESRDFYAVFMTPMEFTVRTDDGRALGTVPVEVPFTPGQLMIFAGRRWRVVEVDDRRREILVTRAHGGRPPRFGGDHVPPAEAVVAEMRRLYASEDEPAYLDGTAADLLREGRAGFARLGLAASRTARHGDQLLLLPWAGAPTYVALLLALAADGIEAQASTLALGVPAKQREALLRTLARIAGAPPPDGAGLAARAPDLQRAKFDGYLDRDLLARCYASERLDTDPLPALASALKTDLERL